MSVDGEKLLSNFLRTHASIVAEDTRIVGRTPGQTDDSWVMVTQLGGGQTDMADHLIDCYFQIDCYAGKAGGQPEANSLAAAVRTALRDVAGTHSGGVASPAWINDQSRVPDEDLEPIRERVILTVSVPIHA